MTDNLRTRIAKALFNSESGIVAYLESDEPDLMDADRRIDGQVNFAKLADVVIAELNADCIYRYTCASCGDFSFDRSERMQRFALLHEKSHR